MTESNEWYLVELQDALLTHKFNPWGERYRTYNLALEEADKYDGSRILKVQIVRVQNAGRRARSRPSRKRA